jgi:hypothetical protein
MIYSQHRPNYILAIASMLLAAGVCVFFILFMQSFVQYALNMFSLAIQTTGRHLHITPLH